MIILSSFETVTFTFGRQSPLAITIGYERTEFAILPPPHLHPPMGLLSLPHILFGACTRVPTTSLLAHKHNQSGLDTSIGAMLVLAWMMPDCMFFVQGCCLCPALLSRVCAFSALAWSGKSSALCGSGMLCEAWQTG